MTRPNARAPGRRRGIAAVEFALVLPVMLTLLVGVWEVGRLIHAQQIMNNAARTAARLAAQAYIVTETGAYTEIHKSSGYPNLDDTVRDYLTGAGITDLSGLQITFQFLDGDTSRTDPYQGKKNERFKVSVRLPYANVRWTTLSLINPSSIGADVTWQMMVDDPFTVNTTVPGWSP